MVHGWLSARGNVADESIRADFSKGQDMALDRTCRNLHSGSIEPPLRSDCSYDSCLP